MHITPTENLVRKVENFVEKRIKNNEFLPNRKCTKHTNRQVVSSIPIEIMSSVEL